MDLSSGSLVSAVSAELPQAKCLSAAFKILSAVVSDLHARLQDGHVAVRQVLCDFQPAAADGHVGSEPAGH